MNDLKFISLKEYPLFNELEDLDKIVFNLYGETFADNPWTTESFSKNFNLKFESSQILLLNDKLQGYCISSVKGSYYYIHRFVMRPKSNIDRLSAMFFNKCLEINHNYHFAGLMVNNKNTNAIKFYENFGFEIVTNYLELKGVSKEMNVDFESLLESKRKGLFFMHRRSLI